MILFNVVGSAIEEIGLKAMEHSSVFMPVLLALLKDVEPTVARQSIVIGTKFFCSVLEELALQVSSLSLTHTHTHTHTHAHACTHACTCVRHMCMCAYIQGSHYGFQYLKRHVFFMILFIIYVLVGNLWSWPLFFLEMIFRFSCGYRFAVSGSIMCFEL